jgi:tetratricopeptide (TPR) repeat protein
MLKFLNFAVAIICGAWLTGCASTSPKPAPGNKPAGPSAAAENPAIERLSPDALQHRADAYAYFGVAISKEFDEAIPEAKTNYLMAALADPLNEDLILDISLRFLQLKDATNAHIILTNAAADPKASADILAQFGRVEYILGNTNVAVQANRSAINKAPKLMAPYRNLAQIYYQQSQYDEGIKALDQAAKQTDVDPEFLIDLGQLYMVYMGSPSEKSAKPKAVEAFKRAASMEITNLYMLQTLADSLTLVGETEKAADIYQKLLTKHLPIPGLRERLADIYISNREREKAAEQLQSILKDRPTHPQANFMMGRIALEDNKTEDAIKYFKNTITTAPDFQPAYYMLGIALLNGKDPKAALDTLGQAHNRFKPNFTIEFYTALAYGQLKDYTNVIVHLTAAEVVALSSDDTNRLDDYFYFQLGAAYERTGNFADSEKNFLKCLAQEPTNAEALNYLGYMYAEKGTNLTVAREMIEKALAQEPKNGAFLDSLGWVYYQMGNKSEALKYILQAVENTKEPDATLLDHLGDCYSGMKENAKARDAYRKALAIEPSDAIRKKLDAIPEKDAP